MATISENKDIDYIQKDFDSSMDAMIAYANVNFGPGTSANRLWTNFNSDSFSRNWLEIVAFVTDALFFYFDVQATQTYLQTATVRSAVEDIAKQFGFTPATASSASGDATFTVAAAVTIPRGFKVQSTTGEQFFLTNAIVAGAAGEFTGTVLQGVINSESFAAVGLQNEEFDLAALGVIRDLNNTNPLDVSPQVTVNGVAYTLVDSFIRHDGSDTNAVTDSLGNVVGGGGRVFTLERRRNGTEYIRFGDGIFGRKLAPSDAVIATYRTGGGSAGNIAQQSLSQLIDSATNVTSVTNAADFSGGADQQSIEQLRELIPASLRTLERAVAEQDYSDILIANFSEVFAASTEKNDTDPGVDINIYVVPQGTGITKISDNTLLANRLTSFLELRKMVTVQFQFLDAFGVDTLISLEVFITDTASKTTVANAINTAINNFFDLSVGGSSGAGIGFAENILLKDIGDLVQAVEGVERFEIKRLTYRPRIDKNVLGLITEYQASEVNIFPNVSESEWLLASAGPVGETVGDILYDNTTLVGYTYEQSSGKITYASDVDLSEVAIGDTFNSGAGAKEVSEVTVLDDGSGEAEQSKIVTVADEQGTQEITEIVTVDALNLGGSYITLRDAAGSVAVWFDVDSLSSEPSHGANRSLEVNVAGTDLSAAVASALAGVITGDSEFTATVSGAAEETDLTFPAKAALNDSDYFLINSANDGNQYYVYFDTTGTATDPAIAGRLPVIVDVQADTTADDVAASVQTELDLLVDFNATVLTDTVTVTNTSDGNTTDASNVSVTGMTILVTTQGVNSDTVTVTNADKASYADVEDGDVSTGFTINTTQQGIDPDTLDGTYFLLYDNAGSVAFWFDVVTSPDVAGTIPAGASAANRAIEITTVVANMSANDVATQVQLAVNADSQFSATVLANEVSVTDDAVGTRDNAADGVNPTGFTFSTPVEGADAVSINTKYWLLNSPNNKGVYYVWYNNTGTPGLGDPTPVGTSAGIEVAISAGALVDEVADNTAAAIDSFVLAEVTRIVTNGGATLDGRYFILHEPAGSVGFWYDVSGSTSAPTGVADRLVEITTVLATDSADDVGTKTAAAINADASFSAITDPDIDPGVPVVPAPDNVLVTSFSSSFLTDSSAGTSGFTVSVDQQGVEFYSYSKDTRITTTSGAGLDGKYFILESHEGTIAFWYDATGATAEPAHGAARSSKIDITGTESDVQIAALVNAAINAEEDLLSRIDITNSNEIITLSHSGFSVGTSGFTITTENDSKVTIINVIPGVTLDTRDGDVSFTFSTLTQGTDDEAQLTVQGVDNANNIIYIARDLYVSTTVSAAQHGRITNGNTTFNSFRCYKKILAQSTNLSVNSITDNNLDLSIVSGTGSALSARVLIDNTQVFVDGEYATGDYFLVDGSNNIWEIVANNSNTITTGVTSINDAAISQVAGGDYKIVNKLVGSEILFNGSIFNVQFNSHNTIFSIGAQFQQIGTIGDGFQISTQQAAVGNLGTSIDIISFNDTTKTVRLNGSPDLTGINNTHRMIDSSGQVFNITASDGRSNPNVAYTDDNATDESILEGTGTDSSFAQGFKVTETDIYTVVSLDLRREGNIVGNLLARIVEDDGAGKPDLTKLVAISQSFAVTDVSESTSKTTFSFANPPTLTKDIQYHLVLSGDAGYQSSQDDGTPTFNNTGLVGFTFALSTTTTGVVSYTSSVDLSSVLPGNFFRDNNGDFFKITAVDNTLKTLTINITTTSNPDTTVNSTDDASCYTKDNIYISFDDVAPSYADGEMTTFDGVATWSSFGVKDAIFSVEGPQSVTVDSNLIPATGPGATISTRYYDDNNELSLVIGLSEGTITFASDVDAYGKGTVGGIPNSNVDTFIFRTSRFADDVVNLRLNEIPQITSDDINISVFGGVD